MEQEAAAKSTVCTDGVTLHPFDLADVDAMTAWVSDPEVMALMTWEPYPSRETVLAFLRDTALPHPWFRAVCLPGQEDDPVGSVTVSPMAAACHAELGYELACAHWGKGVVTAAVRRVVATVFSEVEGLEHVEALVDVRNVASQGAVWRPSTPLHVVGRKSLT